MSVNPLLDLVTAPGGEQVCPFTACLIVVVVERTVVGAARTVVEVAFAGNVDGIVVGGVVVVVGGVVLVVGAAIVVRATLVVGFVGVPFAPDPQPATKTTTERTTSQIRQPDRSIVPNEATIVSRRLKRCFECLHPQATS